MEVTFKARARTLDMLGRQQIAGIPTAISELFKNAHDADAERVEVDYYRSDGLFVLRDDGFGMETQEFVDRWLTIATETSIERKRAEGRRPKSGKLGRPILGEKGIGRLAIATIAPQVLVLTRALRDGVLSDLTAAFLNWRVFECPGLNLQDIRIPLRTFPGGSLPDGEDIADMVDDFRSGNASLRELVSETEWNEIHADLGRFGIDPLELAEYLDEPTLVGDGHGTHFYLLPASPNLADDIAGDPNDDVAAPLQKALLGFTTPSFANGSRPVIHTAFRDHGTDGSCEDLIGESEFFTPVRLRKRRPPDLGGFRPVRSVQGTHIRLRRDRVRPCDQLGWREGSAHGLRSVPHQFRRSGRRSEAFDPATRRTRPHATEDQKNRGPVYLVPRWTPERVRLEIGGTTRYLCALPHPIRKHHE